MSVTASHNEITACTLLSPVAATRSDHLKKYKAQARLLLNCYDLQYLYEVSDIKV